jgi:hypothetical protein
LLLPFLRVQGTKLTATLPTHLSLAQLVARGFVMDKDTVTPEVLSSNLRGKTTFCFLLLSVQSKKQKVEVDLGVEPSSPESESGVLNRYTNQPDDEGGRSKKMINVGVEPKTLALLAPRSNQLS